MTIEEAIEALSLLKIFDAPNLNRAVKMAISALRAQKTPLDRSRWDGCPCCEELSPCDTCTGINCHKCLNSTTIGLCPGWEKGIRFCQNCGRPLTEEAWAELKRRMR